MTKGRIWVDRLKEQVEQFRPHLDKLPSLEDLKPEKLSAQAVHHTFRRLTRQFDEPGPKMKAVTDISISGLEGDIPVRLYTPHGAVTEGGPTLVYLHGGGWLTGSIESHEGICLRIASGSALRVLSVEYRLAPDHPFPAATDDCEAALKLALEGQAEYGIDPAHIAIGGDSAGGGHAAVLAAAVRGMDDIPVSRLLMIYPMLDDRTGGLGYSENITGEFIWTVENNRFGWASYLGGAADLSDGCVPARLESLEGFPPTFIATGDLDLFMEENILLIERLQAAGITADIYMAEGAYHGFNVMVPDAQVSKAFHAACAEFLKT